MANITERNQTDPVIGLHHQDIPLATGKKVGIDRFKVWIYIEPVRKLSTRLVISSAAVSSAK